jgi:hypothetical protein
LNLNKKLINAVIMILIISVGIMGTSYALLDETIKIQAATVMGSMDVSFSDVEITVDMPCEASAFIIENGKGISFSVENATPACTITLLYTISNTGTVPILYQLGQADIDSSVTIQITADSYYIRPGEDKYGAIIITLNSEARDIDSCGINLGLNFQQSES